MKCLAPLQSLQWFSFAVHLSAIWRQHNVIRFQNVAFGKCHYYIRIFFPSCEKSTNQPVLFGVHLGFGNLFPAALSDNNNINNIQSRLGISQIALFVWLPSNASTGSGDTFWLNQQTRMKFQGSSRSSQKKIQDILMLLWKIFQNTNCFNVNI